MKRRHFLEFTGSLFASLGLSQIDVLRQANRYAQVLAQGTPRKLALLVGINDYQSAIGTLQGCLTDVEMQRELLINRFGFNRNDILEVKNAEATRQGILTAFNEHLIKQAKPGDVVVFHYSGHGSRVLDPDPIENDKYNSTLVPSDRPADSFSSSAKSVPDIMGQTLFLLMSAVDTENLTVVLDSCYSGGGKRGNVIVRAARKDSDVILNASPEEFEYQKQWLSKLNIPKEKFFDLRRKGVAKGVVITSARYNELATDAPFDEFHAGAFTYLLTRYLWQETDNNSLETIFGNLALRTKDIAKSSGLYQEPEFDVKPGSNYRSQPIYFLSKTRPAAEAVIQKVTGKQVEFWLGGVASQSLAAFKAGAIFSIIDDEGREQGQITQQSRVGLVGKGEVTQISQPGIVKEGALLREQVRGIPSDLTLRVGIDDSLGAEKAQALAGLQGQNRIEAVSVEQRAAADYLFGRVTKENIQSWQNKQISNPPLVGSLGLFTAGGEPISGSFDQVGESVERAMQRLRPRFKLLLAGRILQTLINGDSSQLNVDVSIKAMGGRETTGTVSSRGSQNAQSTLQVAPSRNQKTQFKVGTDVQIQVKNNNSGNLFVSLLVIDSYGDLTILFPHWDAPEDKALVASGHTLTVPQPEEPYRIGLTEPGYLEVLVLASAQPLLNALKGLKRIAEKSRTRPRSPLPLHQDESVDVMGNLLGDFNEHSRSRIQVRGVQAADTTQLAAISTIIEAVK